MRHSSSMYPLRAALFIALAAMPAVVLAGTWARIVDDKSAEIYVESDTIVRRGSIAGMRSLTNLKAGKDETAQFRFRSTIQNDEYDCDRRRTRLLGFTLHSGAMGQGSILSTASESTAWRLIEPGSWNERKWRLACDRP